MKVTLLDYTLNAEQKIGRAASICYDAKTDTASNLKRAIHCKDKGHLATLRFAYATVNISGISRVCSHQLVRIAHAGILQESQRYVEQSQIVWIDPPALQTVSPETRQIVSRLQNLSEATYHRLLDDGMKKEDARYYLLQQCNTQLNLCLNFQAWQDMLKNRTQKAAQWEIRAVAVAIQNELNTIAPNLFDAMPTESALMMPVRGHQKHHI